ncbi:MAG: DUF3455 domain-containing protein [Stellaceae bacterium]|jgi:hypothetical protein
MAKTAAALRFAAEGVQVYVCAAAEGGFAWRLKGPEAKLFDASGREAGTHFAGPTWQGADGSAVVGEVVANSPAPQAGAIPWLLLRAASHRGNGIFSDVNYILRVETSGGLAPQSGCAADQRGAERRVPYRAVYLFFHG